MADRMFPPATRQMAQRRRDLALATQAAFDAFGKAVFSEGALSAKMKRVPVIHPRPCFTTNQGHSSDSSIDGWTKRELGT